MPDPTIPELVARLRELHNARRYPTETLATTIRDDQSAQVYATSTGPMRVVRPVAETTVDHADLIAETLNALPAILDALDHIGDANKMATHSPDGGNIADQFRAAGQRLRAQGVDTAAMAAEYQESRMELCRWRPISEPPSAGVHAWCGGWYLFREPLYDPRPQRIRSRDTWVLFDKGTLTEYLPIPPSAGESEGI